MRPEHGGPQPGRDRGRRERPFETVLDGHAEALADEVLARERLEHRVAESCDVGGVPEHLERVHRRLAEVQRRVDEDPLRRYAAQLSRAGTVGQRGHDVPDDVERVVAIRDRDRVGARGSPPVWEMT